MGKPLPTLHPKIEPARENLKGDLLLMTRKMGTVFIAGLDLSGSTVLDLALGSLPGFVGLGEVDNILVTSKRRSGEEKNGPIVTNMCSCGQIGENCPVWGRVLEYIDQNPKSSPGERYRYLAETVRDVSPQATWIVDSSKEYGALKRLIDFAAENILEIESPIVLFIRRGPVSWLISDENRALRRGRKRNISIRIRRARKWSERYKQLDQLLLGERLPVLRISLREFQIRPSQLVSAISETFDLDFPAGTAINLSQTRSHVLWGSHHRLDPQRSSRIIRSSRPTLKSLLAAILAVFLTVEPMIINYRLILAERGKVNSPRPNRLTIPSRERTPSRHDRLK
jgi:hypothetical protein